MMGDPRDGEAQVEVELMRRPENRSTEVSSPFVTEVRAIRFAKDLGLGSAVHTLKSSGLWHVSGFFTNVSGWSSDLS